MTDVTVRLVTVKSREVQRALLAEMRDHPPVSEEVRSMNRKNAAEASVIEKPPLEDRTDMQVVFGHSQPKIGTLSFPVRGKPVNAPESDNTDLIAEVIKKRQPSLLLCAGWTVPTEQSLDPIIAVTRQIKTVVVLETTFPTPVYFRIADGRPFRMGKQFFSTREDTKDESLPRGLADALPERSFTFCQWDPFCLTAERSRSFKGATMSNSIGRCRRSCETRYAHQRR